MSRTITVDDITVELHSQTIRMRMHKTAIYAVMRQVSDDLVTEIGLGETSVLSALLDFAILSTRIVVVKGKLDFDMLQPTDTEDMMKSKFIQFIDSKHLPLLDAVIVEIRTMDRVHDEILAPTPLSDDTEKKS